MNALTRSLVMISPLTQPDAGAERQRERRWPGTSIDSRPSIVSAPDQRRQADEVGDRQVERPGQDRHRLADGDDAERHAALQDVGEVAAGRGTSRRRARPRTQPMTTTTASAPRSAAPRSATVARSAAARRVRCGAAARHAGTASSASCAGGQGDDLLLGGAAGQLAGDAALVHHDDAVAHADQLGQLGRDHQRSAVPWRGQVADQLVDGRPWRPTSMPRVGSSNSSTPRLEGQPLGQHDLLLVAAGQEPHLLLEAGRPQLGHGGQAPRRRLAAERAGRARRPSAQGQQRVVAHRLAEHQALGLAVLGEEAEAGARCRPGGERRRAGPAVDLDGARR